MSISPIRLLLVASAWLVLESLEQLNFVLVSLLY
jgi:hypothetical protein